MESVYVPPIGLDEIRLETADLILRRFVPSDVPRIAVLANDMRVADTVISIPHPYEAHHAQTWLATHDKSWLDGKGVPLALTLRDARAEEALIGACG
jgi:RimJ/RimL family protein N-acetyltransferase